MSLQFLGAIPALESAPVIVDGWEAVELEPPHVMLPAFCFAKFTWRNQIMTRYRVLLHLRPALRCITMLVLCVVQCTFALGDCSKPKITSFDAPGAGKGPGQGTFILSMNDAGATTGYYIDSSNVLHGFVRSSGGEITSFDAPNAGAGAGQGTLPQNINSSGEIGGTAFTSKGLYDGFVRHRDGSFTVVDVRGQLETSVESVMLPGWAMGLYADQGGVFHVFLYAPDGAFTYPIDAPGAGTQPGEGTVAYQINSSGTIVGFYVDAANAYHGFVRSWSGTLDEFTVPGSGTGSAEGTTAYGINASGTVASYYTDDNNVAHGYLRTSNGDITTFDPPGSTGTYVSAINREGAIPGYYLDARAVAHGFLRARNGQFTYINVSGAGRNSGQGTAAIVNNVRNQLAGYYLDSSNVSHGFVAEFP